MLDVSVVVPAYNEAENIPELVRRVGIVMSDLGLHHELIIVDDGSTDTTYQVLSQIKNPEVKAIFLSRNFGHQAALNAGLDFATGSMIAVMDADLQHPPEVMVDMYRAYKEGGEIIIGVRKTNTQNSFLREKIGVFFYYLIKRFGNVPITPNAADFGLYSQSVISVLKQLPERDRFLRGLVQWVGFEKRYVEYAATDRFKGVSKYNIKKLFKLAVTGITSFSAFPLRFALWLGLGLSAVGALYVGYVFVVTFILGQELPPGWASLIITMITLGGIQLIILGILGEYLFKIYNEIKGRPLYIVSKTKGFEKDTTQVKSLYGVIARV